MQATLDTERGSSARIFFLLLLALVVGAGVLVGLGAIPLSKHASKPRIETSMNAARIISLIEAGSCRPVEVYYCPEPGNEHLKVICKLNGKIWGGVIVGLEGGVQQIVSGYPAKRSYWDSTLERDGCTVSDKQFIH